jgi:hypothetical protein
MVKKVGYASPPDYTKWQKGQSGNPSGRKKGQKNLKTDLVEELSEVIQLTEGGKPKKLTKQRAMLKSLLAKAIKGDTRAAALMLNLFARVVDPDAQQASADLDPADQALLDAYVAEQIAFKTGGQP